MSRFSCEIYSPEVERAIWNAVSDIVAPRIFYLHFRDGQWRVTMASGEEYSVYNGTGLNTRDGFGLERINEDQGKGINHQTGTKPLPGL